MIYCVSDIHGNKKAWEDIKNKINFSAEDEMYILGDVIDRGEYGVDILKEIMDSSNMHMILGNHEYMMLNALKDPYLRYDIQGNRTICDSQDRNLWYYNGGKVTHKAFKALPETDRKDILEFLHNVPINYEIDVNGRHFILVHANVKELFYLYNSIDPSYTNAIEFAVWDRRCVELAHQLLQLPDDFIIIHGHTPTINLVEREEPMMSVYNHSYNCIDIDCGAAYPGAPYGGRLACICLDNMEITYSE